MSLYKSAFIVGGSTLISRIFGYIRDICIAYFLGVGALADAFFVAARIPNCFRSLFAEGALNSSFVPLFSKKLSKSGRKNSLNFANHIFSLMIIILIIISAIIMFFMPEVVLVIAPGFDKANDQFSTTVELSRITFPYLTFIALVSLQSGILNSFNRFGAPAITSVLLNICMIISLFTLPQYTGSAAHALAWGITISGIIQFLWLYYSNVRIGVILVPTMPRLDKDVKLMFKKMVPGIIGSSATQLNIVINTMLATMVPSGVSYLYYADRLVQFPMAIIGTAMGTALLPTLSRNFAKGDKKSAISSQNSGLEYSMLFTIPAAFALGVIAHPLIETMFARGAFSTEDVASTAIALMAYCIGLPAFVLVKIFAPGFFANGDTKTPVKIALISIVFNIIISLLLISKLQHVAMALGTSFASILNASLLYYIAKKRNIFSLYNNTKKQCVKIFLSSIIMAIILFLLQKIFYDYFKDHNLMIDIIYLFTLIIAGLITFFSTLWLFGGLNLKTIKNILQKKKIPTNN